MKGKILNFQNLYKIVLQEPPFSFQGKFKGIFWQTIMSGSKLWPKILSRQSWCLRYWWPLGTQRWMRVPRLVLPGDLKGPLICPPRWACIQAQGLPLQYQAALCVLSRRAFALWFPCFTATTVAFLSSICWFGPNYLQFAFSLGQVQRAGYLPPPAFSKQEAILVALQAWGENYTCHFVWGLWSRHSSRGAASASSQGVLRGRSRGSWWGRYDLLEPLRLHLVSSCAHKTLAKPLEKKKIGSAVVSQPGLAS